MDNCYFLMRQYQGEPYNSLLNAVNDIKEKGKNEKFILFIGDNENMQYKYNLLIFIWFIYT